VNALGDFQTPPELASLVVAALRDRGVQPVRVLEPTCGSGAFLDAAAAAFPAAELLGIEYQRERYGAALDRLRERVAQLAVRYANAYELDFAQLPWRGGGELLVVGNPPWVTAAALGRVTSGAVQPPRSNPHRLRGLAARTGAANFDVAEFLFLKLLADLSAEPVTLALLVKESVARNVLSTASERAGAITAAEVVRIDARRWFDVAVDACCLIVRAEPGAQRCAAAILRADFDGPSIGRVAATRSQPVPGDGVRFRQGIKHDAADVFELRWAGDGWVNGFHERVDVEPEFVYPLIKARALHAGETETARGGARPEPTAVLVPQQRLGAATDVLAQRAPRLWRYFNEHGERIDARKSSIYRQAPRFAIFGVGPYTFAPWKVAVAGLYAQPRFRIIGPRAGRPVILGDTSYFAAFDDEAAARAFACRCMSAAAAAAVTQRIVRGKRPITKALLDAIDWSRFSADGTDVPDAGRAPDGCGPGKREAVAR
jgi:hypothetical protein